VLAAIRANAGQDVPILAKLFYFLATSLPSYAMVATQQPYMKHHRIYITTSQPTWERTQQYQSFNTQQRR